MQSKRVREKEPAAVVPLFRDRRLAGPLFIRACHLDGADETAALAEGLYREATRLDPSHTEAWNNLGVVLYRRQDEAGALDAWGRVLLIDPAHADAHNNIGHVFQMRHELEAARTYLARAVRLAPEMVEARVNLAFTLQGLGLFDGALRHWGECLRRAPVGPYAQLAKKHAAICKKAARA